MRKFNINDKVYFEKDESMVEGLIIDTKGKGLFISYGVKSKYIPYFKESLGLIYHVDWFSAGELFRVPTNE